MRAGFLAVLLAFAAPATAQTVAVQSGDHPGFTRLVLSIGADREWELEAQSDTEWTLSISPPIDRFDVSRSFDLIQRTRLSDLTGDDSLALALACACGVTASRYQDRFLVIDITDPDPNAPQPEPASPELDATRAAAAAALPDLADLLAAPSGLPAINPLPEAAAGLFVPLAEPQTPAPDASPNPRLAEAAEIMAEQLARAAASGLLDASLGQPMTLGDPAPASAPAPAAIATPDPAPHAGTDLAAAETADAPHIPDEPGGPAETGFPAGPLPIRAETGLDAALQLTLPIGPPRDETGCQGTPFDVRDWASGNGFDQELGALQLALYDERDVLSPENATALVRHYLYYGFGAEALYWLDQIDAVGAIDGASEDLRSIAAMVDGAETAPFPAIETPEACSPGELLWRYMAGAVRGELGEDDTATLQRAYGELPSGLRDLMGPRLARQLAADGHDSTARNIRDALQRGGRIDPATLGRLDFDLGIAPATSDEETRLSLAETLRDDGGDPVSAMAHALAFDRSIGQLPEAARVVAAEALLREVGDGPETASLWHEVLLAHAALGQIDRALGMLDYPAREGAVRARALTDLIAERVAVGDTAALVILAYTHGAAWRPEGSAAGRIQVQAIAALRAEGLLEAAQILRDVRQPLILPAPDAPVAEPQDDLATAWRDGDWTLVAEGADGPHADIAARMAALDAANAPEPATDETGPAPAPDETAPAPIADPSAPDLDALSATVTDSRALRAAVADLLARPALP